MTSPTTDASSTRAIQSAYELADLIHPVDPETFQRDYRDTRPLIVRRSHPGYYAHLLSLSDMDAILATMSVPEHAIRLAHDGKTTELAELAAGDPGQAAEVIYGHYRKGATVNINALNEHWPPLDRLRRALTAELTATTHINVYLTPRHPTVSSRTSTPMMSSSRRSTAPSTGGCTTPSCACPAPASGQ